MGRASLPTTLKNETGTGAKAHSSASGGIISQNAAKDELKSLSKEYDVEQFLKDREDILAKDARYGKTRFSESRIEDNGGVGGWEYKRTPAGYDKNYNADFLTAKADVAKIRGGKIDEQGSKIEQARVKREVVKGEAPGQHPGANSANEKIINQPGLRLNKSREKLIKNTDVSRLNDEQKSVYDVFVGKRDKVILQGKDLGDLYSLEQGGKNAGAKKIMIKHAGIEKTGGLSNDELLNIMDVVRNGKIADDSFELRDDIIRYAYDLKKEDINFRVVIDEFNDGKKIFDYYSDRNFIDYGTTQKRLTGNKTFQSAPMAKDSQGLAFSPYKDDAQRVAQTKDYYITKFS